VTEYSIARQRLGKLCLKAGIAVEAEVNLLGNERRSHYKKQNSRGQLTVRHGDIFGSRGSYKREFIRE
jgi:hypothetical protein